MIVAEGAVSRQLSAIIQNQMPLRANNCELTAKAHAVIGVRLWIRCRLPNWSSWPLMA